MVLTVSVARYMQLSFMLLHALGTALTSDIDIDNFDFVKISSKYFETICGTVHNIALANSKRSLNGLVP